MSQANIGIVYCLTIPRMPGIVKIGFTSKTMEQRLKDLDNTSVVEPFQLYYAGKVRNPMSVEKKIHDIYREFRVRSNREFFEVDEDQVKRVIQLAEIASLGAEDVAEPVVESVVEVEAMDVPVPVDAVSSSQNGLEILERFKSSRKKEGQIRK
jgi:hypothetical protein